MISSGSKISSTSCSNRNCHDILNTTILEDGFYLSLDDSKNVIPSTTIFKCWQIIYDATLEELRKAGVCDKFNRLMIANKSDITMVLAEYFNQPVIDQFVTPSRIISDGLIGTGNTIMPEWINVLPISLATIPIDLICNYLESGTIIPPIFHNSATFRSDSIQRNAEHIYIEKEVDDVTQEDLSASINITYHNQYDNDVKMVIKSNTRRSARFIACLDLSQPFIIYISMHRSLKMEHKLLLTIQKGGSLK